MDNIHTTPQMLLKFENFYTLNLSSFLDFSQLEFYPIPSLIIDYTFEGLNLFTIDLISDFFKVPYITLTKPDLRLHDSHNRIYAQSSISEDADTLTTVIKNLKWNSFTILTSNNYENLLINDIIKKAFFDSQIDSLIYDRSISEEMINTLIKKCIRATGVKNVLFLDSGESLKICIKILKQTKINKYGYYFVFGTCSIFSIDLEGAVIIDI